MAIAEDLTASRATSSHGAFGQPSAACTGRQPPVGYWKDWENGGRLMRHTALSALVVQTFGLAVGQRRTSPRSRAAGWAEEGGEIEVPNPKHPKRLTANDPETGSARQRVDRERGKAYDQATRSL